MKLLSEYDPLKGYYRNKEFTALINMNNQDIVAIFDVEVCKEVKLHKYYPEAPNEIEVLWESYDITLIDAYSLDGEDVKIRVDDMNELMKELKRELKYYV